MEPITANPKTNHLAISLVCNMTRVPPGMRNELASFVIDLIKWKGFQFAYLFSIFLCLIFFLIMALKKDRALFNSLSSKQGSKDQPLC